MTQPEELYIYKLNKPYRTTTENALHPSDGIVSPETDRQESPVKSGWKGSPSQDFLNETFFGKSWSKVDKVRKALKQKGLPKEEVVITGEGSKTLSRLTQKGEELLREQGYVIPKGYRKGGPEHIEAKKRVRAFYEVRGWKSKLEYKRVDVFSTKSGKSRASQVVTMKSGKNGAHLLYRVKEALKIVDEVEVVPTDKRAERRALKALKDVGLVKDERVRVRAIWAFRQKKCVPTDPLAL